ncbi:MAG: amino acid adenylation domain-containing protein [Nitrospiraceae bacterium]|nr:MAG: amino acid adenylation domain-containing protein [Nitrospiraceae bacterium]
MFEEQVEKTPHAAAVICDGQELTYRTLNDRANQLAHYLRKQGVGPEVLVGICVDRSLEMVVGLLGILKAGGAYVPMDPAYPQERLKFIAEDAGIFVLVALERLMAGFPADDNIVICLDRDWEDIARESKENPAHYASPDSMAYVIYTSGSTGRPKGVVIEHGSVACFTGAVILQYGIVPADRVLQFASISFDASVEEIYPCLASGATLVLRTDDMLTSVHDFLKKCAEWELTVLDLPTAYWHELVLGLETDKLTIPDSVRVMIIGGEKALPERLLQWRRRVGAKVRLVNTYGPTEATVAATLCDLTSMNTENVLYGNVPIGRPMPHMKAHIFDPFLQPVPIGASGELYIGGAGVARGYLKRPELTVEKFIPDPFDGNTHGRLYKTGDLVRYLPDGNIEFLGRLDHQVKIRGYRIEPGEIESVLRQHSCVKETVVLAGENHRSYRELIAYIVPDKGSGISAGELRSHLSRHLPEYMIPTIFVVLDALPMTPSGKVDRRALHEHDRERPDCEHDFVEPRTPAEELVGGIWSNVLGLKAVGIHDNFFELGGHSLMATQVISRVRTAFQVEIPLRRLFETPTVEGLAEAVSEALSAKQRQSAPPIVAVAREGRLPLSFAQERLWFLGQLDPHSAAYNIPLVLRLTGQLNVTAMEKGLGEILRRHEVLRTTFITENDQPSQRIGPAGAFLLWQVDLSEMPEEQREAEVLRLANEEATRPFDLEKGPLLKAALLRLSGQEHVLLLTVHHIVSDGWSTGIIYRELSALYEAFSQGMPSPLPELPIQYADFAIWQRQWLQGDILETQLAYWKKQLTGNLPILELPTDHVRPAVRTFRGDIHTLQFPQDLKGAIQKLSHEEGMTLFMVLLAAFQCLLHRYTGQDDIIVGTPIANRNHEKIERLTGCFVNTLVMRTTLSGDPSFRELLKQVRTVSLDAYAHQDLPFEKLVEELRPARDLSHTPLFQVMFALQNEPVPALRLTDLTLSPVEIGEKRTKFDLEVSLWETEEGLSSALVYSTDLFDATTIERMACHYQRILSGVSGNPDLRISELPLTTETEQHQLLREFNNTTSDFPDDKCIHELFEEQAEKTPDATAVVFGDDHLTYRDLNRKADELAHYLRKQGVAAEVLVGICVERSLHMVIGALGILKAGGAYVPLDPSYPKERLAFMVKDTKAPLILTQKKLQGVLPKHAARVVLLDSEPEIIAEDDNTAPAGNAHADNLAYVIYTSGSTGRPKGVCVPHRAINRLVMNTNYIKIESSDRIAQASSFSFDAVTFELWGALLHGACLVGITRDVLLSAEAFSRHIKSSGISVLFLTTALFNQMAREVPTAFSSIRYLLIGGEIVDTDCVRTVVNTAPPQYLLHVYGPTENTTFTSWYQVDNVPAHARTIPIGKPLSNTTIYLLDRSLQTVPVGVPGELYAGGDGLARGYLNRPELNAVKFIPDPFGTNPGARLYKTGDIARYRSDGNIEFLGRIDNQVKIRGFRIEPGEIEAALRRHPAVEETVVLVREDHPGNKRIVAYVVPHAESTVTMNELRGLLKMQLPDYMVPGVFVHIDALPLTVNGKIDRTALPKPEYIQPEKENLYVAPRNELEKALVKTWEKVLRIKPVGIADNFFELGGHSLLTVQMIAEIRKTTGKNVKVMDIFRFPTIRQLAVQINKEGCSLQFTSLYPIESAGDKPPFFWIHGDESNIHLPRYIDPGQPLYGFAHQGQDRRSFPYRTVEEIAAHYLEELRTLQPEGPYMLGGYCFGALVALEMAQMMFKNAQHVHMLFLIDPSVYGFSNLKYADNVLPKTDTYFFSRVRHHRKRISSLSYTEKMVHAFQTAGNILRGTGDRLKKSKKIQRVLCRILLFAGLPLTKDLRRFYLLEELYAKAIRSYTLRKYPGRIVLCMSDEAGSGIEPFWSTLAEKGLKVHVVPESTHIGISGILEQQHVAVWARWLNTYLNEV